MLGGWGVHYEGHHRRSIHHNMHNCPLTQQNSVGFLHHIWMPPRTTLKCTHQRPLRNLDQTEPTTKILPHQACGLPSISQYTHILIVETRREGNPYFLVNPQVKDDSALRLSPEPKYPGVKCRASMGVYLYGGFPKLGYLRSMLGSPY